MAETGLPVTWEEVPTLARRLEDPASDGHADNQQILAARYQMYLPTEEELHAGNLAAIGARRPCPHRLHLPRAFWWSSSTGSTTPLLGPPRNRSSPSFTAAIPYPQIPLVTPEWCGNRGTTLGSGRGGRREGGLPCSPPARAREAGGRRGVGARDRRRRRRASRPRGRRCPPQRSGVRTAERAIPHRSGRPGLHEGQLPGHSRLLRLMRYTQSTQGHLNSQGLCYIDRQYPAPAGGS
jgi:hypothetical protein